MSSSEIACRIDDLSVEAEKIHSLQEVIYSAVYTADVPKEISSWAFDVLRGQTAALLSGMNDLAEEIFNASESNGEQK